MRRIYSGAWVERDRDTHKIPGRCSASSITSVGAQSIAGRCSYRRLIPASRRSSEPWRLSTDSPFHAMEVMPDHVRLFIAADPTRSVAEIVNRFASRRQSPPRDPDGGDVAGGDVADPLASLQLQFPSFPHEIDPEAAMWLLLDPHESGGFVNR